MRWSLFAREAAAYLHTGLMVSRRHRVKHDPGPVARRAVTFVPGVGGHGAQFLAIRARLETEAQVFAAFEYSPFTHPKSLALRLRKELENHAARGLELVVIGHSLGGVLGRMALQERDPLPLFSFVSICAPLAGTWRSRVAPHAALRALVPDSPFMEGIRNHGYRLDRYRGRILTIAADHDVMVKPAENAHLPGHTSHVFGELTHNAALLDPRVHALVARFVRSCAPT